MPFRTNRLQLRPRSCTRSMICLCLLLLSAAISLSSCGRGSYSGAPQIPITLSGNWQFTMAPPAGGSFQGGLQGGFLLQNNGSVTGSVAYAVSLPNASNPCNTGSAAITGTISGENIQTLTAVAGTQTFTLTGTLSFDGSTMAGTYSSTAGTAANGTVCGTEQNGLQWSAVLVPPLTGSIQGSFHSTGGSAGLNEQDFLVSGSLTQAANTGTSSATVTGTLSFLNPTLDLSDYPCISTASIQGQISGSLVTLQMIGPDGPNIGQIGSAANSDLQPANFYSTQNGGFLQAIGGPSYAVYAAACGGGSLTSPADTGNICLAVNSTTACQQPITLTPSALIFPTQNQGTMSMQTITLANSSSSTFSDVTLTLTNSTAPGNYTETDTCGPDGVPSLSEPFYLYSQQSCVITITFTPQCGAQCPPALNATLTVTNPATNTIYTLPVTGTALSDGTASTPDPNPARNHILEASLPSLIPSADSVSQTEITSTSRSNQSPHAKIN